MSFHRYVGRLAGRECSATYLRCGCLSPARTDNLCMLGLPRFQQLDRHCCGLVAAVIAAEYRSVPVDHARLFERLRTGANSISSEGGLVLACLHRPGRPDHIAFDQIESIRIRSLQMSWSSPPDERKMAMRRILIVCVLVYCCRITLAGEGPSNREGHKRPNILVIIPDQLRAQALGCMANPDVRTPEIDKLAAQGILFRQTFANAPVCCPARATLLTGKYPNRHGLVANDLRLRESQPTLAKLLKAEGYQTGFVGKWHLDGGKRDPGFVPPGERRQGFDFWAACECRHDHFHTLYFRDSPEPIRGTKFEPEVLADVAIDFFRDNRDRPFFLIVSMGPPHDPYGAPEKYMKMYDPAKLTMRKNWHDGVKQAGREQIAAYYAAITAIDDQVGRIMQALKDLDMDENTIVLFTSDHGDMLGSQGASLKRKPWEESIRVPGILRYPARVKAGRQVDTLLSHVDVAPTLLSLCGAKVPRDMQGTDLSKVVLGKADQGPESVFFQIFVPFAGDGTPHPWRGVRTPRYMYARTEKEPWVLYDLEKDPDELHNLAKDPAFEGILRGMDSKLTKWMKDTGDLWRFNSDEPVEDQGRLYRFETFYTIDDYLKWAKQHPELAPKE